MTGRSHYGYSKDMLDETDREVDQMKHQEIIGTPILSPKPLFECCYQSLIYCRRGCKFNSLHYICRKKTVFMDEKGCLDFIPWVVVKDDI